MFKLDTSFLDAYFTMVAGKSFMTVSKRGVSFSQAAIVKLEKPEFVIVLFDTENKQMAIQAADKDDTNITKFLKRGKRNLSVRWNNAMLKEKISTMMSWDLSKHTYKIEGSYDNSDNALIFDLPSAQVS